MSQVITTHRVTLEITVPVDDIDLSDAELENIDALDGSLRRHICRAIQDYRKEIRFVHDCDVKIEYLTGGSVDKATYHELQRPNQTPRGNLKPLIAQRPTQVLRDPSGYET